MAENAKKWMHAEEAPQYLEEVHSVRRSKKTLAKLRCIGGGPEFRKAGRYVIYAPEALDAYAASIISRPLTSTADYTVTASAPDETFSAATERNSRSEPEVL